jgi:hypothetical protein
MVTELKNRIIQTESENQVWNKLFSLLKEKDLWILTRAKRHGEATLTWLVAKQAGWKVGGFGHHTALLCLLKHHLVSHCFETNCLEPRVSAVHFSTTAA